MMTITQEKRKEYNSTFLNKHRENLYRDNTCDICNGKYKTINKDHHKKTQKHKLAVSIIERFTTLTDSE
jgi:hypothetical protein